MAVEESYTGPVMSLSSSPSISSANPKVSRIRGQITKEYIDGMKEWFREGKVIPKRHAWEIVLGAWEALSREDSLVDVRVQEGEVVDVVGDTHGQYFE